MNWFEIWTHIAAAVAADSEFASVIGDAFYLAGSRPLEVPSMTAMMVVDTEEENWAPSDWQFDIYAHSMAEINTVEKALRRLLNQPWSVTLGEVELWCDYTGGQLLIGPERDPYFRRLIEFRFTPVGPVDYRPPIAQES